MAKKTKLLFITVLLSALFIFSAYAFLMPTVHAAEPSLQATTLTVLNDVIGINTNLYNTSKSTQRDAEFLGSSQIETDLQLSSAQSNLRVTCSYVKDTLKLVYLSDLEGELSLKQPANNTVDMAKGLLERYQNYSNAPVYGKFASMLSDIEVNVDETKYAENVKLEVSGSDQNRVSYMWTYVDSNGVLAEKKNLILVYEKGAFKGFFNNWLLYTIAESKSKFSAEQATELAIEASRNFSYPVTCNNGTKIMVSGFSIAPESLGNAKLIYVNSVEQEFARGGDPYELYLAWYVPLGFDKFYPGDVSGLTVILWADTGEVCGMDRVIVDSGLANSSAKQTIEDEEAVVQSSQTQLTDLATQTVGISMVAGLVLFSLASKKIMSTGSRKRTCKFLGTLLCISVAFSMILVSLPIASATSPTGRSRVYSCYGSGTQNGYRNQTADDYEQAAIAELCNYVGNASIDAGYVTSNSYSNTINTVVVSDAGTDEQNYEGTMLFHAGHFSIFNKAYQDSNGFPIYASDIINQTGLGRHFFVFLWVCVQAENLTDPDGTPIAWTHRDNSPGHPYMSEFGFNESDGLGQCYISFYGFSPMLSTYVNQSGGYYYNFAEIGSPGPCSWFATKFYYYALYEGYSVHDSLDIASGEFFGCDYIDSVLNTGYHSWWPGGNWSFEGSDFPYMSHPGYYPKDFNDEMEQNNESRRDPNRMQVFGDSSIKLYQPKITMSAHDNRGVPVVATVSVDGEEVGTTWDSFRVLPGTHQLSVSVPGGFDFDHYTIGTTNVYTQTVNWSFTADTSVGVHYVREWGGWPPPNELVITAGEGGTTIPEPGGYNYYNEIVDILAVPAEGYVFDHWYIEWYPDQSDEFTCNPVTVYTAYGYNDVYAYFAPVWNLTISAGAGGTTDPEPGTHPYVDETVVEVTADADQGSSFSYWLLDDEYVYTSETIYVTMDGNRELEAHFDEQLPPCEVGVIAVEYCTQEPVPTPVYIDSEYVGWPFTSYEVTIGEEHSIEGDWEVYVPNLGSNVYEWYVLVDDEFYDYGCYAEVTPTQLHMTVTFVYIWQ